MVKVLKLCTVYLHPLKKGLNRLSCNLLFRNIHKPGNGKLGQITPPLSPKNMERDEQGSPSCEPSIARIPPPSLHQDKESTKQPERLTEPLINRVPGMPLPSEASEPIISRTENEPVQEHHEGHLEELECAFCDGTIALQIQHETNSNNNVSNIATRMLEMQEVNRAIQEAWRELFPNPNPPPQTPKDTTGTSANHHPTDHVVVSGPSGEPLPYPPISLAIPTTQYLASLIVTTTTTTATGTRVTSPRTVGTRALRSKLPRPIHPHPTTSRDFTSTPSSSSPSSPSSTTLNPDPNPKLSKPPKTPKRPPPPAPPSPTPPPKHPRTPEIASRTRYRGLRTIAGRPCLRTPTTNTTDKNTNNDNNINNNTNTNISSSSSTTNPAAATGPSTTAGGDVGGGKYAWNKPLVHLIPDGCKIMHSVSRDHLMVVPRRSRSPLNEGGTRVRGERGEGCC